MHPPLQDLAIASFFISLIAVKNPGYFVQDGPPEDTENMFKLGTDASMASLSSKTDTIRTEQGFTLSKIDTSLTDTAFLRCDSDIANARSIRKSSYSMADSPKPSLISLGSAEAPDELRNFDNSPTRKQVILRMYCL